MALAAMACVAAWWPRETDEVRIKGTGATTWAATGSVASTTESITLADGTTRTYQIYLPASYDGSTATPLLLVFHGGGGNGKQIEKQTGFDAVAEQNGFIAVYPDGSNRANSGLLRTWNAGQCCGYAQTADIDDDCINVTVILNKHAPFCKNLQEHGTERLQAIIDGTGK